MHSLTQRLSPRSIRILYTCTAILVLGICSANFVLVLFTNATSNDQCRWTARPDHQPGLLVTDVVPNGVTDRAGVKNGDILLQVDGKEFGDTAFKAQALINSHASGDTAVYLLERDGVRLTARVEILKVFNFTYLAFFLLGLGFLIVGYVVVMTKPEGRLQRLFGRYGIFAMLFFGMLVPGIDAGSLSAWKLAVIYWPFIISRAIAPPTFLLFFLNFPVRRTIVDRRWFHILLYVFSCLCTAVIFTSVRLGAPPILGVIFYLVLASYFIGGLVVFAVSYVTKLDRTQRRPLRHILASIAIGLAALGYTIVVVTNDPLIIFLRPAMVLPVLLLIFVPFGFGYAIFRYRLMDIDLIIKRSLIYGGVTALLAAIYLGVVFGMGSLIGSMTGQSENRVLSVVGFIAIALLFDPLKRRVQDSIDRTFYRERRNYQKALLEFSQELPRQMHLSQILDSIVSRISVTMHVEKVAVVICEPAEGCSSIVQNIDADCCQFVDANNGLIALLRSRKAPQSLAFVGEEAESVDMHPHDRENIIRSGIVLAVPMFIQDRLIGMINVGPKLSGRYYSQEDIDLLATVAGQAAIAIENARLHRSEIDKQKIEEELNLARRIQQGLLPKENPTLEGLDIAGISLPALTVGGDYFDFIRLGPRQLLVVVADVSGKGMSAALYMSKVQGMIQLASHMYHSPKEMLIHVNRRLYEGIERRSFVTMILALFDMDRRDVRICRAGHNRAIIGSNGSLEQLHSTGIGLGLEPGPVFEENLQEIRYPLAGRELFLFYSDGLTETMNSGEQMFGEDAMVSLLAKVRHHTALEIEDSLLEAVRDFQGTTEQHDDVTIVVVKAS